MRGFSYLSSICLIIMASGSYAFQAQSEWGAMRAPTPLAERDRAISMRAAHETLLSKQPMQEWVIEPRTIVSEQRMVGDRTSLKRDVCACIFVSGVVAFITWVLTQQSHAH